MVKASRAAHEIYMFPADKESEKVPIEREKRRECSFNKRVAASPLNIHRAVDLVPRFNTNYGIDHDSYVRSGIL